MDLERKVRQLDNDVHAIYDMLSDISISQRDQANRLGEVSGRLSGLDGRLSEMDGKLERQGNRLSEMDGSLSGLNGKLDTITDLLRPGQTSDNH